MLYIKGPSFYLGLSPATLSPSVFQLTYLIFFVKVCEIKDSVTLSTLSLFSHQITCAYRKPEDTTESMQ